MQSRIIVETREESVLATNKVLRNTYFLLAMTLTFSAVVAFVAMSLNLPPLHYGIMLVGFYGLLFLNNALSNSGWGILSTFALTGFLGYSLGPILNAYVGAGLGDLIVLALAGTAAVFFACSAYVLTTKKDMFFLSGMMFTLFIVLVVGMIASFFFNMPGFYVALSSLFIVFSSMGILYETSNIIHGGETNYIRATVSLYVSLYNIFVSLLNLLRIFGSDD
ncbi:Bax inhibitor-1/YccA family protein [Caviibacterium pharyngocola]|uniref:BAX inhibitor protein n=1 Tax=Caviibacterium pharyngocola TaxID=28159 RepID=A0A2M8RV51_9PAST|nr:Bax inhibitor-1/YccA family protein [Caviibacterium pharyngocola]PJG82753.1 BAX inhibitor protein [Caviibacterium pharyngocola]